MAQLRELFDHASRVVPNMKLTLLDDDHFHGGPLASRNALLEGLQLVQTKLAALPNSAPGRETYRVTMYLAYTLVRVAFAMAGRLGSLIDAEYDEDSLAGQVVTSALQPYCVLIHEVYRATPLFDDYLRNTADSGFIEGLPADLVLDISRRATRCNAPEFRLTCRAAEASVRLHRQERTRFECWPMATVELAQLPFLRAPEVVIGALTGYKFIDVVVAMHLEQGTWQSLVNLNIYRTQSVLPHLHHASQLTALNLSGDEMCREREVGGIDPGLEEYCPANLPVSLRHVTMRDTISRVAFGAMTALTALTRLSLGPASSVPENVRLAAVVRHDAVDVVWM
jgi:hypothetical protein